MGGGACGGTVEQVVALRALNHHATSTGMFSVVNFLCRRILAANASPAQRDRYLRSLVRAQVKPVACPKSRAARTSCA